MKYTNSEVILNTSSVRYKESSTKMASIHIPKGYIRQDIDVSGATEHAGYISEKVMEVWLHAHRKETGSRYQCVVRHYDLRVASCKADHLISQKSDDSLVIAVKRLLTSVSGR